jgi:phage baseplate assembly protein V
MYQRLQALIALGRISFVDDSGVVQEVQVVMNALDLPSSRFRVPEFGFTSNPPVDSDAIVAHVAGDRSSGVVLGTNHQPSRPTGLQPGEAMLYSEDGKSVYVTAAGGIVVEAKGQDVVVNDARNVTWNLSGKLTITAPGGVEFITPIVASTGDIQDNTATNENTMAEMRTKYDEHGHPVVNVQTGGSTITTGTPTVPE